MSNPEEVVIKPLEVVVKNNNFEQAFRLFKSLVQKEGVVVEYKRRMKFEKTADKKKRKQREAKNRKLLADLREKQMASGEWEKIQKRKDQKKQKKMEMKKSKESNDNE
jgi:small subunit ribosomal protein S21